MNVVASVDESASVAIDFANLAVINDDPFQALGCYHSISVIQLGSLLIIRPLKS